MFAGRVAACSTVTCPERYTWQVQVDMPVVTSRKLAASADPNQLG